MTEEQYCRMMTTPYTPIVLDGKTYDARELSRKIMTSDQQSANEPRVVIDSGRLLTQAEVKTIAAMARYDRSGHYSVSGPPDRLGLFPAKIRKTNKPAKPARSFTIVLDGKPYDARNLARKIMHANQRTPRGTYGPGTWSLGENERNEPRVVIDSGRLLTRAEVGKIADMTGYGGKQRAQIKKQYAAARKGASPPGQDKQKSQIAAKIVDELKKMVMDMNMLVDTPQAYYQHLLHAMQNLRQFSRAETGDAIRGLALAIEELLSKSGLPAYQAKNSARRPSKLITRGIYYDY